jgi:HK97 family phage major capsid protein
MKYHALSLKGLALAEAQDRALDAHGPTGPLGPYANPVPTGLLVKATSPEGREHEERTIAKGDIAAEFVKLQGELAKRDEEIKTWAAKASSDIDNAGKISTETKAALEKLSTSASEIQGRLTELEQKLAGLKVGNDNRQAARTLGELATEGQEGKDTIERMRKGLRGTHRLWLGDIKAITSATSGAGGVGDAILPDRQPRLITPPDRQFFVRDLILPGQTASNAIEFIKETLWTNAAAPVAEAAAKPESTFTWDLATAPVRTVAHWIRATRQVLDDVPLLRSYIDGRLRYGLAYTEETQLLLGDGTGQNLLGLIPQATAYNTALNTAGMQRIDIIRKAMYQVTLSEYRPSGIVLNPLDWMLIELTKDNNGNYIWANPTANNTPRLWGLPVIESLGMTAGQFLVGAFNLAAQIFDRMDAEVLLSTEDQDNFIKNLVTIRAEERLALVVYRPLSFVNGAFGTIPVP